MYFVVIFFFSHDYTILVNAVLELNDSMRRVVQAIVNMCDPFSLSKSEGTFEPPFTVAFRKSYTIHINRYLKSTSPDYFMNRRIDSSGSSVCLCGFMFTFVL